MAKKTESSKKNSSKKPTQSKKEHSGLINVNDDAVKISDEMQLVTFKLDKEMFAVDVTQVREIGKVEKITHVPRMPMFIDGVMNLRGQITMIIDLRARFSIPPQDRTEQSRILVTEVGDSQLGIIVDSVEDVITVPTNTVSPPPKMISSNVDTSFLTRICKLPKTLVMLLDLENLLSFEELTQATDMAVGTKIAAEA